MSSASVETTGPFLSTTSLSSANLLLGAFLALIFSTSGVGDTDLNGLYARMEAGYRVECLVPFKSLCYMSREEVFGALLIQQKAQSLGDEAMEGLKPYETFNPLVIERGFGPASTKAETAALTDVMKSALLDADFLKDQLRLLGRTDVYEII